MAEALTPRADPPWRRSIALAIVAGLLAFFAVALLSSMARDSSTWDEGNHIYAGLPMWKRADFGLNPEHPPLVKLLATTPLLGTDLRVAEPRDLEFVKAAFLGERTLLIENDTHRLRHSASAAADRGLALAGRAPPGAAHHRRDRARQRERALRLRARIGLARMRRNR